MKTFLCTWMCTRKFALVALMLLMGSGMLSAQTIKGTVTDSSGEAVIGATIQEKGGKGGTVTDFDGNFSLTLSGGKEIVVSYVGMKTQTVNVAGKSTVNIVMQDEATALNELVVIGYGAVKKKDITGSVATVGNDVLQAVPVASASEALTGKLAGVQVTTTEGSPDADVIIRVRGGGSVTQSNEPLYIVDGFPVDGIGDIPASDIEDITVLKDASSTAIYGSRGANGVILVTTKSGQAGKVKVSYNAYYSWKKTAKTLDVLGTADYLKWQYEYSMLKSGKSTDYEKVFGLYQDRDLYDGQPVNDWQDMTFGRTGHTFNHNVSVNGGSDNIKYAFSYAHMNDKAIMYGSSFKRDNFSLKVNTKPTKKTTLDLQVRYSNTDIYGGGANDATSTSSSDKRLRNAVLYPGLPIGGLAQGAEYDDDEDVGGLYHPFVSADDNDRKQQRKNLNMAGSFGWEIFKNFKAKTEFGYDNYTNYDMRFYGKTTYYARENVHTEAYKRLPALQLANTDRHRFRNTNTVSYDFKKLFSKDSKHALNAMVGHEYVITKKRTNTDMLEGFPASFDFNTARKLTVQGHPYTVEDAYSPDDKLLSFFGRANYDYDSKYLLSVTFRADASSKFSKENRWGYFPSAALAWRISSEEFMAGTRNWLDDLKLRLSYGTAGNNGIDPGYLKQDLVARSIQYVNGFTSYMGATTRMANPDLKWETTITRNVGLDFTLWGSKLTGSVEAYLNSTKDLLIDYQMSGAYTSQYRNLGETQNRGIEASLTYNIVNKKDWGLSVNGNIGFNKSKIKSLGEGFNPYSTSGCLGSTEIPNDFVLQVGSAVGLIYGYVNDGRYETSDFTGYNEATSEWILKEGVVNATDFLTHSVRPGDMKVKDLDNSGDIKTDGSDMQVIGNTNPDFTGGFAINARAYGFDLSANFNFSVGNDVYNANKIEYTTANRSSQYRNMSTMMADGKRWTNIDAAGNLVTDLATLASMNANTTMWSPYMGYYRLTDWAVEDGSFLRLNTLTLGYTLPETLTKKAGISSLRFYVTGYNLFCITGYSGFDPEVSTIRRTGLTPGVDYSAYPKSRQLVFGLNLNF